jgi:hypothetical protein
MVPTQPMESANSAFVQRTKKHEKTAKVCTRAVQCSRTAHPFQTAARAKPRRAVDLVVRIRQLWLQEPKF